MIGLTAGILSLVAAQTGPVGWWRGDDGATPTVAADSSGSNRNGTYTGGATTTQAPSLPPGLFNNESAFQLDGTDDEITIPSNAAFNIINDFSVAFWVRKAVEKPDYVRLVGKGGTSVRTFGVWDDIGPSKKILFQQFATGGGTVVNFNSTGDVETGVWTHVACVVNGTTATTYLNAVASGSATRSGTVPTDTQPVRIGYGEIHDRASGQIDEVRIFNRFLTLTEIQTLAGLLPSAVPNMPTFTGTTTSATTVNWNATAGADTYVVQRSENGGAFSTVASGIAGLTYTDSGLTPGSTYAYVVYAVGLVNSADSTANTVLIPFPSPRTNDHGEGLFDDKCGCGTASGTSSSWAVLAAALALLTFRKR
jgi:MYXO-CTERM domain-containing protein